MKLKANKIRIQYNENREPEIVLSIKENVQADVEELKAVISKGKELVVEVKQFRAKRSLDSNSYMWLLLGEMASVLNTTKDELYLQVLDRYGVYTHMVVKPNVVERVKAEWKLIRELGEVTINGKTGVQLQCYFGSSSYNSKEMSTLVNGVVSEAKEIGISTLTPSELSLMSTEWGKNNVN